MLDTLLLSRMQFALNISFHILFPTITIALAWFLFYFKLRFDVSQNPVWMRAYRFWVKVFALCFALGVVSGITMSFQFGTNWPGFMEKVGNIAGPLLAYEVLTAFFMEATFLGIMLFASRLVPPWLHTLSIFLVAIGTTLSAFWILALNSWMHTPTGFELRDGIAYPTDWLTIIFNPSFPYRFLHTMIASGLTASFFIAGLSAYRLLHNDEKQAPRLTLKTAITVAAILAPIQALVGDFHGLNTLEHQPAKIAAMEGVWKTETHVPLVLFGYPNQEEQRNDWALEIPNGASLILTHRSDGEIKGLSEFNGQHPPVKPVFFAFRIMIGCGVLMILSSAFLLYRLCRFKSLTRTMLKTAVALTFIGWVATLAGWYVTEVGRQPWLVYGVLHTADAVTTIENTKVGASIILYALLYLVLLVAFVHTLKVMARKAVTVEEFEERELKLDESLGKPSDDLKPPLSSST